MLQGDVLNVFVNLTTLSAIGLAGARWLRRRSRQRRLAVLTITHLDELMQSERLMAGRQSDEVAIEASERLDNLRMRLAGTGAIGALAEGEAKIEEEAKRKLDRVWRDCALRIKKLEHRKKTVSIQTNNFFELINRLLSRLRSRKAGRGNLSMKNIFAS